MSEAGFRTSAVHTLSSRDCTAERVLPLVA
jgi:hypothetical protein